MINGFFLVNWIYEGMRWLFTGVTQNVFWTIVIATVFMKAITLPLDIKSRKSSMKMAQIQPEIEKLKKKYAGNTEKFNREQQKLMKSSGASMMAGCLPMLITMVLFFCFISAFNIWADESNAKIAMDLNKDNTQSLSEAKWLWVNNIWQPDNGTAPVIKPAQQFDKTQFDNLKYLTEAEKQEIKNSVVYNYALAGNNAFQVGVTGGARLSTPEFSFADNANGISIEEKAKRFFATELPDGQYQYSNNGWFILPVLVAATSLISSLLMAKTMPAPAAGGSANPAASNKMMTYMMPALFFFSTLNASAAFAIYWFISTLVSIASQLVLKRLYPRTAPIEEGKK